MRLFDAETITAEERMGLAAFFRDALDEMEPEEVAWPAAGEVGRAARLRRTPPKARLADVLNAPCPIWGRCFEERSRSLNVDRLRFFYPAPVPQPPCAGGQVPAG